MCASSLPALARAIMNGHFSAVGDQPQGAGGYEHGVQVIDEDKAFKYAPCPGPRLARR